MPTTLDLSMRVGDTFQQVIRWESAQLSFKPITGATQEAPTMLSVAAHGLPTGWRVQVESVKGMTALNDGAWHQINVANPGAFTIDVNASQFKAYTSGGYIRYHPPVSLAGYTANMSIKDKAGGTELLRLDTLNGYVVLDDSLKTITLNVPASITAGAAFKKGVYDLELVSGSGVVTTLVSGSVVVTPAITTN